MNTASPPRQAQAWLSTIRPQEDGDACNYSIIFGRPPPTRRGSGDLGLAMRAAPGHTRVLKFGKEVYMNKGARVDGGRLSTRGNVLAVLVGVVSAGVAAGVVLTTLPPGPSGGGTSGITGASKPTKVKKRRVPTSAELRSALSRCGLTPDVLAAAGVSAMATPTLVGNARQYLTDHPDDLSDADTAYFAAQASSDQLMRKVQQGQATSDERAAYVAVQTTLASAKAGRDSALEGIKTAASANLSQNQQNGLATIKGNSQWKVPLKYLAANRTDAQWVALREALANDRQASDQGVDPDATCHQRIVDADAVAATTSAGQNLTNHLADVRMAFNNAMVQLQ
jgi:hypothetical protein